MPKKTEKINPFSLHGSRITGLISLDQLADVLNAEAMNHLADLARLHPGDQREWFKKTVFETVRGWLKDAHEPPVREVAQELDRLKELLHRYLDDNTLESREAAVSAYENLSPEALREINPKYRAIKAPTVEHLKAGDDQAFLLLFGLIPVDRPIGATPGKFLFRGTGSGELTARHRPRASRIEQLLIWLAPIYYGASGKMPKLGPIDPFRDFAVTLLRFLLPGTKGERGDKPIRRAIEQYNRSLRKSALNRAVSD